MGKNCARVFATMASSTDVERFFKITKAVCADHRSTLSSDMVNICASLNVWLTDELDYRDSKEASRQGKSKRFTTLNANLEMVVPVDDDSEDEDDEEGEEVE